MRVIGSAVFVSRLIHARAAFFRLPKACDFRLVALKTGVLIQAGVWRIHDLLMIGDLFVMGRSGIRLTQINHACGLPFGHNPVLIRVCLFLAALAVCRRDASLCSFDGTLQA